MDPIPGMVQRPPTQGARDLGKFSIPAGMSVRILQLTHRCVVEIQSSGSSFTILWSWLLPTQNVTGVVELSTNTVRMLVSDGIRY